MTALYWLIGALILGIIEVLSVDLIFLMFAGAALLSGLASWLGLGLTWQIVVFVASSGVFLALVRPWARALIHRNTPDIATNVQALEGTPARVTEQVTEEDGRILLNGEIWSARCAPGTTLPVGARVLVESIDGAIAVVVARP